MLAKRIIPCLDVTAGRVVKGVNFVVVDQKKMKRCLNRIGMRNQTHPQRINILR